MLKTKQIFNLSLPRFNGLHNSPSILFNAFALCAILNSNSQSAFAASLAKAPAPVSHKITPKVETKSHHLTRRASTSVSTLRLYTKVSDIRASAFLRHLLLKSATSADSPDTNPDVDNKTAAGLNLNINETLAANLFRQDKFDLNQLDDIDKENFVLGNLTHDNVIHIAKGNALFVPKKDIVVIADLAEVRIASGAMVGVLRPTPDIVSIYDLEDGGSKKVVVKVGDETIPMSPGKNLIITKEANDFEKINPAHRIAYRKVERKQLKSGMYAYSSEFSISSAVLHVRPLQNILLSSDPADQKIADRVLKNFVILEDVYSGSEPYKMPASIVTPVKISSN